MSKSSRIAKKIRKAVRYNLVDHPRWKTPDVDDLFGNNIRPELKEKVLSKVRLKNKKI